MSSLTVMDHSRDSTGMTYVYPVISRRSGGVSVGINLNPNNACNWRCIYCQVPDLKRGGPPPIDLCLLGKELRDMLNWLYVGDYLDRHVPPDSRRIVDIAFSGNGEPTSAKEFPDAVNLVGALLEEMRLAEPPRLRLITNGSLLDRKPVQVGIAALGKHGGEAWFKIDTVGVDAMKRINGIGYPPGTVLRRLRCCAALCQTWVQTCFFGIDGKNPARSELDAYLDLLGQVRAQLAGVHIYGLARPSMQPEASRLASLPSEWLKSFGEEIVRKTGLTVKVSP